MDPVHLYKCPGAFRTPAGVRYGIKGVSNTEELQELLDAGWHLSLEEAAKACGPRCLVLKRAKPKRAKKNLFKHGIKYRPPKEPYIAPEPEEEPEEAPQATEGKEEPETEVYVAPEVPAEHYPEGEPPRQAEEDQKQKPEEVQEPEEGPKKKPEEPANKGKSKLSENQKAEVLARLEAKESVAAVAKRMGVSASTIRNIAKKA